MSKLKKILDTSVKSPRADIALLIIRVGLGCLMFRHGWSKLTRFEEIGHTFSDPLGVGSQLSLVLTVFAEAGCSVLLILGLFTRLALVPLIITMCVVVFVVHGAHPFARQELGLLFLICFTGLMFTGPGRYAADRLLK